MTVWSNEAHQVDAARSTDGYASAVMRSFRRVEAAVADFLITQELQPDSETEKLVLESVRRRSR